MKKILLVFIIFLSFKNFVSAQENKLLVDNLFHIDQMNSHNESFALYFKTREKPILARGENSNYINDYPKDLYIYDYKTKSSSPLISYEWFPKIAKYFLTPCFSSASIKPSDKLTSTLEGNALVVRHFSK